MLKRIKDFLFINRTTRQTVAKNTFWQFVAQILGRLVKAVIVIYAARVLGADQYGVFTYAIGFASLFSIIGDFGIDTIVVREIAKGAVPAKKIISAAIYSRFVLEGLMFAGIVFVGMTAAPVEESRVLMPLMGFIFVFDAFRQTGFAIVKAMEKMQVEAGIFVLNHAATVVLGIGALLIWKTPFSLAVAYAVGSGIGFLTILYYLRGYVKDIVQNFDLAVLKQILKDAWPFAFLGLTGTIMVNADTVMLGWFTTNDQIGIYNAALRPVKLLFTVPTLLTISLLPVFSRNAKHGLTSLLEKSMGAINLISIPLTVGGFLMADFVITLLFGTDYLAAIDPFKILIFVVLLNFPASVLGYSILAHNKQIKTIPLFVAAASTNIILNLVLIPRIGILGAAIATLISEIVATIGYYFVMKKIERFALLPYLWRPLMASGVMAIFILMLKTTPVPDLLILIGAIPVYFGALLLLKDPIFGELKKTFLA